MFQLVKLRADIARVRRHMEERGQAIANTRSGAGDGEDGDGSDDDLPPPMHMEEVPPPLDQTQGATAAASE